MTEPLIFHIDVNSAYLSWEACFLLEQNQDRFNPSESPESNSSSIDIRLIPAVIGGNEEQRHGIVLAKSTTAKAFGIRTGEPLSHARRKCPNLKVYPPHHDLYAKQSKLFMELLMQYAPIVEQISIDEAFCDMSGTALLYGEPVSFANFLKDKIKAELGFTVNIGISSNKLLAKMASDFEKPDQVHTLFPSEIKEKMWPLPVSELYFAGNACCQKLYTLGLFTIGDLASYKKDVLISHLNKQGEIIWNYANGIDSTPVEDSLAANKGYSSSQTISFDVTSSDTAKGFLLSLCETVGARIRADKSYVRVVGVSIVYSDFTKASRQITLDSSTNVTEVLIFHACKLFDSCWHGEPIRQLGVHTSGSSKEHFVQQNLFHSYDEEKLTKLNSAIDTIRDKFGENAVKRARLLKGDP